MDLRLIADAGLALAGEPDGPGVVIVAVDAVDRAAVAHGMASLEHHVELTTSTPLYAASLAKVITAWCVHHLVADGEMSLDDPVSRWLDVPWGSAVTIDHLLQHRSGLPELHALRLLAGREPDDALVPADVRRLLDRMMTWFEPGSRAAYNNTNFATLALVVESITGRRFGEAVRSLAFDVLDMPRASVRDDPGIWFTGMASGYTRRSGQWARVSNVSTSVGDGGMWWSGDDLAGLLRRLLVDDAMVTGLRRRSPLPDASVPSLGRGLHERDDDGWFGAAAEFFGARAELRVHPAIGVAFGVMANSQSAPVGRILDEMAVAAGAVARPEVPAPQPTPGPVPDGVLVGLGGAPWRFAAIAGGQCSVAVGEMRFELEPDGPGWCVRGRSSVSVGWESEALVVRDGGREVARLGRVAGAPVDDDLLASCAGTWWCESAAAALVVTVTSDGATVQRGQAAPEELSTVAATDEHIVLAAPWGLIEFTRDGRRASAVLARAEGVPLTRMVAAS